MNRQPERGRLRPRVPEAVVRADEGVRAPIVQFEIPRHAHRERRLSMNLFVERGARRFLPPQWRGAVGG